MSAPRPFTTLAVCTALALFLTACRSEPPEATDAAERPAATAPAEVEGEPRPLTPEEIDSLLAAERAGEEAANRDAEAEYARRRAAMGGYAECMEQAKDLPAHARPHIEAACGRLPDAPR
jgi:hypothetical protein